jgi:4-amino-4-deoxy-L-arabinose transferase-like glycosyltransferase
VLGEVDPLATRIPSVLSALGCALLALRFAGNHLDRRTRSLAALFVLSASTLLDKGTLGEIDATLCFVVAAALSAWWEGQVDGRQSLRGWLFAGCWLGVAGLLKGPEGPVLFYLTVGPYLVWQRRWHDLFTAGHLACITLAILPSAIWVLTLIDRGVVSLPELLTGWKHQLGANEAADTLADPSGRLTRLANHYGEFPLQVATMLLPAVLWLPFALRASWAKRHGLPEDVRRFLACATLVPIVLFWLYPESRPRHLMPAFFPVCVLAAMAATRLSMKWPHRTAVFLAPAPAVLGVLGVAFSFAVRAASLPVALAALAVTTAWSVWSVRATQRASSEDSSLALAANLSGGVLAAWFVMNAVVVPWQAERSPLVQAETIARRLPPGEPLFTTRTFPGKGEGFYNAQFHLGRDVRAADLDTLRRAAPCTAVVTPQEQAQLVEEGWTVEEVGRLTRCGPGELRVIRLSARR